MANKSTKHRKFLATSLTAAMVASAVAPTAGFAAETTKSFPDVPANHWAKDSIDYLVGKGALEGRETGKFDPNASVTRGEAAKILSITLGLKIDDSAKTSFKDAVNHWSSKYVAAIQSQKEGVIKGYEDGTFRPNDKITRQEMAKMIVEAYELKLNADADVSFTDNSGWGAEYINVLASLGIVEGVSAGKFAPNANVTRAQTPVFVHRAEVKEVRKDVGQKEASTPEVKSVSATNLKEVVVEFNTAMDAESATDKANYSLKSGKAVKSVILSDDKKTATVIVTGTLTNNKADAISISNVYAGDKELNVKNVEFTVVDNQLPEVKEVKSLGTKAVKIVFSEPVTDLKQSNFTIDGKAYFGEVKMGANDRSVILKTFSSSTFAVGDHKITVTGVKDFANFVSLSSTHDFTVVEDKEAPTVTEASATLETVTLTFSEDVDIDTVKASNVYWKSGDTKNKANEVEAIADNKYKFYFAQDEFLPTGKVDIYVEGVKDYSDNQIAKDTKVTVTPEIDQTRPEVRKVSANDAKTVKVTFSKTLDKESAQNEKNYSFLNKDGKVVSVRKAEVDSKDSKTVNIELYTELSNGENTIKIQNVKDATKLKNTMLDYSGKFVKVDKDAPKLDSKVVNVKDRRVVLSFNKKMDVESLANESNYAAVIDDRLQGLSQSTVDIQVLQEGRVAVLTFAETINDKDVVFADGKSKDSGKTNVSALHVLNLKDVDGNVLNEYATGEGYKIPTLKDTDLELTNLDLEDKKGYYAELVDRETIKIKFNSGINSHYSGAFVVKEGTQKVDIKDVQIDGTSVVTLKFKDGVLPTHVDDLKVDIDYTKLVTVAGTTGKNPEAGTIVPTDNFLDSVAPEIVDNKKPYTVEKGTEKIRITYSEPLETVAGAAQHLINTDFKVVRHSDNKTVSPNGGYTVAVDNNVVEITLNDTSARTEATVYIIEVKDAKYVQDKAKNKIANSTGESQTVTLVAAEGNSANLAKAKDAADALTEAHYTSATWSVLTTALAKSEKTDKEIVEKTTAINNAIKGLVVLVKSFDDVTNIYAGKEGDTALVDEDAVQAKLPKKVKANLANGTSIEVPVKWNAVEAYENKAGEYTYKGTVELPASADLNSQTVSVVVVVAAP